MGCHFLLQGIFPTQGWNPGILFIRQSLNSATWEAQRSWYKQLQKKKGMTTSTWGTRTGFTEDVGT